MMVCEMNRKNSVLFSYFRCGISVFRVSSRCSTMCEKCVTQEFACLFDYQYRIYHICGMKNTQIKHIKRP